jgi:hypothetical protein
MTPERNTIFSNDRVYRYTLWREWPPATPNLLYTADPHLAYYRGQHSQYAMFIGLNPSTADETKDDPTIRKCVGFAKRWGFGALCMTNLFAFRATDPRKMKLELDPTGPSNDKLIAACARSAGIIVAAWGVNGEHMNRDGEVINLVDDLYCLRTTKHGMPEHPLYIPYDTQPMRYVKL